jgi:hypothetical protein
MRRRGVTRDMFWATRWLASTCRVSCTRARLDAMLQQLRDEIEQLTGELHQQKSVRADAFRDWGDDDARRRLH